MIACELAETVRYNTGIDWTRREDVHARRRIAVKRLLQSTGTCPTSRRRQPIRSSNRPRA